tara:strand:+ start:80 stop:433 length:354 start_codon:yes stop_codon:yes gene_type:complete
MMKNDLKNKVILEHYDIVFRKSLADLATVPDRVGTIVDTNTNETVSQCTALSLIVNQSSKQNNWVGRFNALVDAGHDPNRVIDYWGKDKTVYDMIQSCACRSREFAEGGGIFVARSV